MWVHNLFQARRRYSRRLLLRHPWGGRRSVLKTEDVPCGGNGPFQGPKLADCLQLRRQCGA